MAAAKKKKSIRGGAPPLVKRKTGAQPGNKNNSKGKPWTDALKYVLAHHEFSKSRRGEALRDIAIVVVQNALNGDMECVKEIGNRMQGRPGIEDSSMVDLNEALAAAVLAALTQKDKKL